MTNPSGGTMQRRKPFSSCSNASGDDAINSRVCDSRARGKTAIVLGLALLAGLAGCSSRDPSQATSDPLAKVRLTRIVRYYQNYTGLKNKPPPNEEAFKEYL